MSEDKKVIYSMHKVGKVHGTKHVLKNISLSYFYGAKIGVLGLNGAGKSTLLRIMAGVEKEYLGETHLAEGFTVGFLQQEPELDQSKTVREVVEEAVPETIALLKRFEEINMKFAEEMTPEEMDALLAEQAKVQEKLDRTEAWSLDDKLEYAMEALRCPPGDEPVTNLSGGERRRVALCRLLIQEPDILLLDEPTNHLDAESVHWLERHLQSYKGTVIAVTHDRYFLDNVAGWILELDRGEGIPFRGNYTSWLEQKQKRLEHEQKDKSRRAKFLRKELEWIKMTPKARHAKGKARINAYDQMVNQEQSEMAKDLKIYIPPGPRLGRKVIEAEHVSKAFGEKVLFDDLNFLVPAGAIVGVVGANGAGKSTLFKLIQEVEKPDSGNITLGETVALGHMEQSRLSLEDDKTVYDMVSGGEEVIKLGKAEVNARAYVASFNFNGQDQQKKIGTLSGGERNRVQLAILLKANANVILLDEPTNDLDVNTLRALEDGLENFAGCAVVISHDRWFLDRIATHILAFEGESKVTWFDGNFTEYEEDRIKRLGHDALKPKRIHYRGLTR